MGSVGREGGTATAGAGGTAADSPHHLSLLSSEKDNPISRFDFCKLFASVLLRRCAGNCSQRTSLIIVQQKLLPTAISVNRAVITAQIQNLDSVV